MNCTNKNDKNSYNKPKIEFTLWCENKLTLLYTLIEKKLSTINEPVVLVLETGHFKLPLNKENFQWAKQNIEFCEKLCKKLIQKHNRKIKIIPTLLLNNLECEQQMQKLDKILHNLLENNKYITTSSIKILRERNLKNRAYNALKNNPKLSNSFIKIDGKAYLKDEEYEHDLAAGFVNEEGEIIPRCGLILTSFLDKVTDLALQRLHQSKNVHMVFVSFSEEYFEYERVKLGVDIYSSTHNKITITPLIIHWGYINDRCFVSHRESGSKKWQNKGL